MLSYILIIYHAFDKNSRRSVDENKQAQEDSPLMPMLLILQQQNWSSVIVI